jgi:hypothetical protein
VLNDGRVVWMRWDYQERGVDEIFSLWTVRPDGSGADGFYRVHIPDNLIIETLRDPKPIEGSSLILATGGSHRSGNEGHIVLAQPDLGINNPEGIQTVTPNASLISRGIGSMMKPVEEGGVPYIGGYATRPTALSEKSFLTAMGFDMPQSSNYWLYYVDNWGNKELIHRDPLMDSTGVLPIRKRVKPPILPDMTNQSLNHASLYMDNVYADLPGVEKGEVKHIRILQQMFWLTPANQSAVQYHPLANPNVCFGYPGTGGTVRVIGTVPVEEDGSAYFNVPARADIYFQALDENFMAVQRMRTHVEFAPGENRGCVGCHETRSQTALITRTSAALQKPVVQPAPPHWGDTTIINYETMIQPIWDAKCLKCHGGEKTEGGLDLGSKKDKYGFMQSFRSMHGLKPSDPTPNVAMGADGPTKSERVPGARPEWHNIMFGDVIVRKSPDDLTSVPNPPKRFGAIRHPLAQKLVKDQVHNKLLSKEEKELVMTWFDVQAPYFDTYFQKVGQKWQRVKVEPYPPFGESREHIIHRP